MTNPYTQTYQNIYDILVDAIKEFKEQQPFDTEYDEEDESALDNFASVVLDLIGEQDCIIEELMYRLMSELSTTDDSVDISEQDMNDDILYWLEQMKAVVEPYELPGVDNHEL